MFILRVAMLALLQSNVPGWVGYTRFHWPFCTWAMTTQGVAAWVATFRQPEWRPLMVGVTSRY
jgi:hypothetical protein